jgi:hypothetical protein
MVTHVNDNGGWTVTGWHRRGVIDRGVDGEETLANATAGHIVYLMPSNSDAPNGDNFKTNKIKTATPTQPAPPTNQPDIARDDGTEQSNPTGNATT